MRATTAVLLAGLALVPNPASAQDAAIRLEPKWTVRERVLVTVGVEDWMASEGGIGPDHPEPFLGRARTVEYEEKVTGVQDGLPMRTVRTFKRHETTQVPDKKPQRHPVHGRRVEFQRVNGVLQVKNEADRLKWDLDPTVLGRTPVKLGADWDWLLPGEAVAVGSSWSVRGTTLLEDIHPELATGETICTVASVDGDIVLIRFRKDEHRERGETSSFRGEAKFSLGMGRVVCGSMECLMTSNDRKAGKLTMREKVVFDLKVLRDEDGAEAPAKAAPTPLQSKWKVGERVFVKLVTTDYATDSGKAELLNTRTVEYEEKATEVKGGLPTRASRTFKRFEAQRSFEDAPRKYAFEGKTVEFRSVEGVLQCDEKESETVLDPMSAGADWAWLLPGKMVAVGDMWKIRTGMHLSTVHWALARGEARCELAEVKDGVALLRFGNGAGLAGEARFDLTAGRVLKASMDSSLDKGGMKSVQKVTFEAEVLKDG